MDNTLISRAVVQSEFRKAADLIDRISGGAGPGGVKAVAPTGKEAITMLIPEARIRSASSARNCSVERARRQRHLHAARPADRRHQQRDDRIHTASAVEKARPKKR